MQSLLFKLGIEINRCLTLWCNNTGAKQLSSNSIFYSRTKHIEIDVHFIEDKVIAKELGIKYVPTEDHTADIFTKSLSISQFHFHKGKLVVVQSPRSRLREHVEDFFVCGKWPILSKLVIESLQTQTLSELSRTLSLSEKLHSHPYLLVMIGFPLFLSVIISFIFYKTTQVKLK